MADIITYPENGIEYDSDDASGYLATRTSGVYSADEDFAVTPGGGLTVTVSAGHAWVRPDRWKGRSIQMTQPEQLVLTDADPTRTRIDRIVLRYDAANRRTRLLLLEGTPDSDNPTAPDISRTALLYDLCLAEIRRTAGSTAITSADITDTRLDEDVCGLMRDGVTGIPTAELVAHYNAILTAMQQSGNTLLRQLAESIKAVDRGSFYTKQEADAKFGTPYSLPAATADALGGVKVGDYLDIAPDGTLSGKTLNDKIAAAVAVKSEPRLVWNTYAKSPERFKTWDVQIPGNVDKICITKGKFSSYGNSTEKNIARGGTTIYNCNDNFTITFQTNGILHVACLSKTVFPLELWIDGYHYPTLADLLTQVTAVESSVTDLQVAMCELHEEKEEN
jgi:hypothetical protein